MNTKDDFQVWTERQSTANGEGDPSVVRRRLSPHLLRQISGPGAPRQLELHDPELLIGRGEKNGLQIDAEEVSRRHAKVFRYGFDFAVRDLGSQNGVWLNDQQVDSATLRDGDRVRIGTAVFLYIEGD